MKHKVVMKEPTMMVETKGAGFRLLFDDRAVLVHTPDSPFIYAGKGSQSISMNCGNFSIEDEIEELLPLIDWKLEASGPGFAKVRFSACGRYSLDAQFAIREGRLAVSLKCEDAQDLGNQRGNRYRIVLPADAEEHIYGCGEQFSYFDLRGRKFPLWTSEQGVGRNKKTASPWKRICKAMPAATTGGLFFRSPVLFPAQATGAMRTLPPMRYSIFQNRIGTACISGSCRKTWCSRGNSAKKIWPGFSKT